MVAKQKTLQMMKMSAQTKGQLIRRNLHLRFCTSVDLLQLINESSMKHEEKFNSKFNVLKLTLKLKSTVSHNVKFRLPYT